jgi:uncharacterized membrane protein
MAIYLSSLSEGRLGQLPMAFISALVVTPVGIPAAPVFVVSVMPLVGSFSAPFAAIGIQAPDGQA